MILACEQATRALRLPEAAESLPKRGRLERLMAQHKPPEPRGLRTSRVFSTASHEESFLEILRRQVVQQYRSHPTGCGGSFGELLCYEIHSGGPHGTGLTFNGLAAKWGISISLLGELIRDHCQRMEGIQVNHAYRP